jgi:pimeloyl-ACP methyl ester carboxylesterase
MPHRLFIHGLEGSSQGVKAVFLRTLYPDVVTPDFPGDIWERMARLEQIIGDTAGWTLIGSSLGGLMATVFACRRPDQVDRLVLLAPALPFLDLHAVPLEPLPAEIRVAVVHGSGDAVVPLAPTQAMAEQLFPNLSFQVVDAGHDLNAIVPQLDWPALVGE